MEQIKFEPCYECDTQNEENCIGCDRLKASLGLEDEED